jgi:hypothetical protein
MQGGRACPKGQIPYGSGGLASQANELLASRYDFFTFLGAVDLQSRPAKLQAKLALESGIYWWFSYKIRSD